MSGVRDSRNPSDCSVLSLSDNRKICGFAFGSTPKFAPQTSHIPGTLCESPEAIIMASNMVKQ